MLEFTVQNGGRKILWLRAESGEDTFSIELLDLSSNSLQVLLNLEDRPYWLSLSPDGKYIAYFSGADGGQVLLRALSNPEAVKIIGECLASSVSNCRELVWERDSRSLAWSDERGVWQAKPDEDTATLALGNQFVVIDPRGESSQVQVAYQGLVWSPLGRYLLAISGPPDSDARWLTVIDTRIGRQVQVRGSFGYSLPTASGAWLGDGRLAIIHQDQEQDALPGLLEVWLITATSDPFIQPVSDFDLSIPLLDELPPSQYILTWVAERDEKSLHLALSQSNSSNLLFYSFDLFTQRLERKLAVEIESARMLPAPGNNALVIYLTSGGSKYLREIAPGMIPIDVPESLQGSDFAWVKEFTPAARP